MKRLFFIALLAVASVCTLHAQAVDVKVCDVVKKPAAFNGKIVRIKGIVFAGFDSFVIKDTEGECGFPIDSIWLEYPQGTKGKAGALAMIQVQPAHNYSGTYQAPTRTPVVLDKSKDFKQFDSLLSQTHNKGGMCLGCFRYQVEATLVGRLDTVADTTIKRDAAGKVVSFGGFGNANLYPARLVLQSVSDVAPKEFDYSASDALLKNDTQPFGGPEMFDPFDAAQKIAAGPLSSGPAGVTAQKDVAAFGKHGDKNSGVVIVKGSTGETSTEGPGQADSPDGVLFTVHMNADKLQGLAMVRAIYHVGQHISDIRTISATSDPVPPFVFEFNAWSMAISSGVVTGDKLIILTGGTIVWDLKWPAADRQGKMESTIGAYLKTAAINR